MNVRTYILSGGLAVLFASPSLAGQVRWLEKGNIIGQIAFIAGLFGLTAVV
jgi:hypothetical protein